eukprot:CAMPEP_0178394098 /NCGR_PEP_ID=MMETSP0689_2-20121128/12526_1 /TAXON_ID=160604 /ORGANISM="Amphidinium massartii, Strain CS-259" /LENGTH=365 /DNA_ID=CAMNT_0020014707 /DNA_START=14 /DNA_END=1108 /DNA_ORIENTATION=-
MSDAEPASKKPKTAASDAVEPSWQGNEAVVLYKVDDMRLVPWPMPEAGPDECVVEVRKVGICGSDVHYWKEGQIGHFVVRKPMVIGHESAGVVVSVGADVTHLKVGDRVAMEPGVPCDGCAQCSAKRYNLCPVLTGFKEPRGRQGFFATPPVHGSMAKYIAHPARFCFKLPEGVSLEEGAMCEPLSVGVYACETKAKVTPGTSVLVFGAGPIGTICAMVAHGLGAKTVILCDVERRGSRIAKTLNTTGMSADTAATEILKLNGGEQVDSAIDCTGAEVCMQTGIQCTKNGGVVCFVGLGVKDPKLPMLDASVREVDLVGVFRYRYTYPKCIQMLAEKKVNVQPLITHRFAFNNESILEAFETCRT